MNSLWLSATIIFALLGVLAFLCSWHAEKRLEQIIRDGDVGKDNEYVAWCEAERDYGAAGFFLFIAALVCVAAGALLS